MLTRQLLYQLTIGAKLGGSQEMIPDYSQVSLQDPPDNNWKLTLTSADLLSDQPKLALGVGLEPTNLSASD